SIRLRRAVSDDILKLAGQEVVVSADVRASNGTTSGSVYVMQLPSNYVARGGSFENITSERKRRNVVLPVHDNIANLTDLTVTLAIERTDTEVKNRKVERGNKATDWSPAPEDIQSSLDAATKR